MDVADPYRIATLPRVPTHLVLELEPEDRTDASTDVLMRTKLAM